MFKRSLVLSLAAVGAVLVLALGCQQGAAPQPTPKAAEKGAVATPAKAAEKPVRGGTIRVAAISEPDSIDPQANTTSTEATISHDFLIGRTIDYDVSKEGLSKDWAISADGKAITFKLRAGVKFHDGTDLDAAAVKANVERIQDKANKVPYASNFAGVSSVDVLDSATVRFNLKAPDPLLIPRMSQSAGMMVSPAAVKRYGQDFGRNASGSGPFQFMEWVLGDRLVFKRFEGYWKKDKEGDKLPYLDQVVFKIIGDETTAFANLRTGQIDLFNYMPSSQLPLLKKEPDLTYTSVERSNANAIYLNTKRPPFDNKALRQAVALAVDREGMVALRGEEEVKVVPSVYHPMNVGQDGKSGVFPSRDLAKAKAKMAEAGYPNGLKVKLTSNNTINTIREAEIVKANLAEIGIEVEIEAVTGATHTTKVRIEQNYQMTGPSSMGVGMPDPGHFLDIAFTCKGSRNYYGPYCNPKVDELIAKAGSIYDQKQRDALYQEASRIIADDAPIVPMYVESALAGMTTKVRNYVPLPMGSTMEHLNVVWLAQ